MRRQAAWQERRIALTLSARPCGDCSMCGRRAGSCARSLALPARWWSRMIAQTWVRTALRKSARLLFGCVVIACLSAGGWVASAQQVQPASTSAPVEAGTLAAVRSAVAAYFGIPLERVSSATNLIDDLKADPADAIEVVALICERLKVERPRRIDWDRITVDAIVEYVDDELASRSRGGPPPQPAGDELVHVQKIMFATDRAPTGDSDLETMFSGARARGGDVTYGTGEVTIPVAVHVRGKEERPWLRRNEDPRKHVVLRAINVLSFGEFAAELKSMATESGGDALLFIHGFNVTFAKAARRTAQIAYDLEYRGVPIMYSWPSDGSLIRYLSDREDVEWSVPHIERFLRDLATAGEVRRLHLIAHSMGNQGLLRALHALAMRRPAGAPPLFENVILAAPDFDSEVFTEQLAPAITSLSRRWTLYASDKDAALDASSVMSARRLGLPLALAAGVDTIDASGIDVTPWSVPEFHSYYSSKRRVLADLVAVLQGIAPFNRNLTRSGTDAAAFWRLSPD
ncbi:MAG: alpha/beta fold hydrolase [Alphaproteobacteria bacterium]|nr:alpha/beta fold hydrolase [Alphaproteobacteria bacterium]